MAQTGWHLLFIVCNLNTLFFMDFHVADKPCGTVVAPEGTPCHANGTRVARCEKFPMVLPLIRVFLPFSVQYDLSALHTIRRHAPSVW
ncbi:hypothetical protein [uncultured Tateyamaria sp.]|uniref:hypothetical protein n=1 Tax=uncultured Tateyamaria sp. TaxID=455651 RepID=UPI00260EAACA|nr:hypothetical protein [uncultured Tateyamaria sp.]